MPAVYNVSMVAENPSTKLIDRIVSDPKVMVGKPVIKGTRLTVERVLELLANEVSAQQIIEQYPGLTRDDIRACLAFASQSLSRTAFLPLTGESA